MSCIAGAASSRTGGNRNRRGRGARTTTLIGNNNMSLLPLRNRHHTESSTSRTLRAPTDHLINLVNIRVNLTRQTIASTTFTNNLNTKVRDHVAERRGGFQVDRVPADLYISIAVANRVSAGDIWRPVPNGFVRGTPNASCFCAGPRWVDIIALVC